MDAELKAKWVKALRSGEYKQTRWGIGHKKSLCCIGVCGAVMGLNQRSEDWITFTVAEKALLPEEQTRTLVDMNDHDAKPFSEIADWIEANL